MKSVDQQLASKLLDDVDRTWSSGVAANLGELLAQVPAGSAELRVELCAADLEWRWRSASAERATGSPSCTQLPAKPTAHDYHRLLAEYWDDLNWRRTLLEAEWCARSLWGDAPDVDVFASQLPTQTQWHLQLAEQLHALSPIEATVTDAKHPEPRVLRVSHDFVMGRRQLGESEAPAWLGASRRLLIANEDVRELSRRQFRVRRTKAYEIEITNTSKNRVDVGFRSLAAGEWMRTPLPFAFAVGDLRVMLDRVVDELP